MPHTKEFIERLRERMRNNNPSKRPEVKEKISKTWFKKGEHRSKETEFKKGHANRLGLKHSEFSKRKMSISKIGKFKGNQNPMWQGDDVGYFSLHSWVKREKGKPIICEFCGRTQGRIEWANKSHEYKRDLDDWISLCKPCHYKYDDLKTPLRGSNGRFK